MTPIPILLYHSISPADGNLDDRWRVDPDRFAEQLDAVLGLGFTPMKISDLVDATENGTLPDRPAAITFDDGRADFAEYALPVLRAADVPSTIYVVTDRIARCATRPDGRADARGMMSWADVVAATDHRVEIGSHSATHPELDVISSERLDREVIESRRELEEAIGRPVRSFAYPHGYHSRSVMEAVRTAGYDSACAVGDGWSSTLDDRFALTRMFVLGDRTIDELRARLINPPDHPHRHRPVLRAGWRAARRVRHRLGWRQPYV